MLTRLLLFALAIISWILIVRFVRSWISTHRQGPHGGGEISGEWEVLQPLQRASGGRIEQLRVALEISDVSGLHAIAMVLEVVERSIKGPEMDPGELRTLVGRQKESGSETLFDGNSPVPSGWISIAADLVRDYRPEISIYEARKSVSQAFGVVSTSNPPLLEPDNQLTRIPNAPPAPAIDQRYLHFMEDNFIRNGDREYEALAIEEHDTLPEGAMLPLIHLSLMCEDEESKEEVDTIPPSDLLKRYGVRLFPAFVAYFGSPKRRSDKWQEQRYRELFDIISIWPQEIAEPLFRAALESGWNDYADLLPDESWAIQLKMEFADSPYGPPES